MGERRAPGPRMRLSGEKRERFLEVLGQTGNRCSAAAAIGVEPRLMDQRRRFDAAFDRQWRDAIEQADRRLAGASGPLDCIGGAEPMVIRRGPGGRARIVKAGPRRWSAKVEESFFAALAVTGNIAASARSVGFSESCIAHRRRKWPEFAGRLEEALEDAELALEFRLAAQCGNAAFLGGGAGDSALPEGVPGTFDPDLALRFLKWRAEKKKGGGRRGRIPAPPSIEEVTESIVRKAEAIRRHRDRGGEREGEQGGEQDDDLAGG